MHLRLARTECGISPHMPIGKPFHRRAVRVPLNSGFLFGLIAA